MRRAPRLIGVVVEGPSDARTISGLTDRILLERAHLHSLEGVRAFCGLDAGSPFLKWSQVGDEARRRPVPRKHGRFGAGEPAVEDARTAYQALQCFVAEDPQPVAVLLVRDSDGKQKERTEGLEQARRERAWPFSVVLGVAHTMRECWVLAAFVAAGKREKSALEKLTRELGFDPTEHSDRLKTSRRPKDVLARLMEDHEREAQCWIDLDLASLRRRGAKNGLAAFLDESDAKLVPLFAEDQPDSAPPPDR